MLEKIIAASLILIPFFVWPGWGEGIRTPKEAVSIVSLLAIVVVSLMTYTIKPFKNKWMLILMGWCFLTTLVGINLPVYYDKYVLGLPPVILAAKSLFYITLAVMTIVCLSSISLDLKKIARVINFVIIAVCTYGILQALGLDEWFRVADGGTGWIGQSIWSGKGEGYYGSLSHRIVSTLGNPAILSVFLSICVPFSLYRLKEEGKLSLVLSILILIMTKSFTGISCALLATLVYYLFVNRKIMLIIIVLSILSGSVLGIYFNKQSKTFLNPKGRIEVIKESWDILYKKPITGMGLGSFEQLIGYNPVVVKKLNNQNWREAHNEYWQTWFETGLIGLILLLLTIGSTIKRFFKNINMETIVLMSSMVAILVSSISYFNLRVNPTVFFVILIYGMLENKIGESK